MSDAKLLTPEMLADLAAPADPRVSPDGRRLLVSVGPLAKKDEHRQAAIWLADAARSLPARQITTGRECDTHPRWSPDGGQVAFLSDRSERGRNQVHLLSLDGGEAREITAARGGVADFCWLPGPGTRIAYLAVDRRDEEDERRREEEREDVEVHGEFWPLARIVILDLATGAERRIDTGERHVAAFAPSPDGRKLAAILWDTPGIDSWLTSGQIAVVDVESGDTREVLGPGRGTSAVEWAADGRSLFFLAFEGETAISSEQLFRVDFDGTDGPRCLSGGSPYCFLDIARPRDRRELLALVATGTESEIHRVDPDTGRATVIAHVAGDLSGLSVSDDGTVVGTLGSTPARPDEALVVAADGVPHVVTDFHAALVDVALGPQEVFTWERAGLALDGILIWPPGKSRADGPLPTIVSIHGGPYGRWANGFIHRFGRWVAQHGYLVFLPNPRGGSGHGQAFAEAVLHTVGNDDYLDIMAGVDRLVELGLADAARLGCGGWSQGGFMTAWIVGHTERFKAGIMGAGVSDWGMMIATSDIPAYETLMGGGNPYAGSGPHAFDAQSPISFVEQVRTPVLIVHGEKDERVPLSQGIFFHRGLRRYGVPTELVVYPREPHGIQERKHQIDLLERIAAWYQRWIPVDR
jgi:dipeptidyl aminopeptidase/acylaminoacyl peptidase